jgi:imidazole glycerol-phosphate synthase subunit HisH
MAVALVDYRAGNLTSVRKALAASGAEVYTPASPSDLARASAVIVPGVGHFSATAVLDTRWREAIGGAVARGCPLLGICLGMQWLFEASDEAPDLPGLGLMSGRCHLLPAGEGLKVPHVGWNALAFAPEHGRLLSGVPPGGYAYFTHSYVAPLTRDTLATTTHGETFASVVERGHVFGAQFHPEKSGEVGLLILGNFLSAAAGAR